MLKFFRDTASSYVFNFIFPSPMLFTSTRLTCWEKPCPTELPAMMESSLSRLSSMEPLAIDDYWALEMWLVWLRWNFKFHLVQANLNISGHGGMQSSSVAMLSWLASSFFKPQLRSLFWAAFLHSWSDFIPLIHIPTGNKDIYTHASNSDWLACLFSKQFN